MLINKQVKLDNAIMRTQRFSSKRLCVCIGSLKERKNDQISCLKAEKGKLHINEGDEKQQIKAVYIKILRDGEISK